MSPAASANTTARLSAMVAEARARARQSRQRVLVSLAEAIAPMDPLDALELLSSAIVTDTVADQHNRMYWTRPDDAFALAGFGAAVVLDGRGADRFAAVNREWTSLRAGAMVDDPSQGQKGVGPLAMGGFSFAGERSTTGRWREFPAARLFVPSIQIAKSEDAQFLTLNLLIEADGEPQTEIASLTALRARVLEATAVGRSVATQPARSETLSSVEARSVAEWRAAVRDALDAIHGGTLEKVVLAREVDVIAPRELDVFAAVRQLRSAHRASFTFGFWHGDSAFVGASPERLVQLDGRAVRASSLAGSAARGTSPADDARQATGLMDSAKDRREHDIVRRALCRSLERLCDDVVAGAAPSLLTLPQVHHLHTDVRARLRDGHSLLDLVAALHPTPAVGGEPRDAALRFIHEHEGIDRGWYAAPIGWLQRDRGEFAVALRCALITDNEAALYAGCGIVADSDPDREYAESQLKLRPMQASLAASVTAGDAVPPVHAAASAGAKR